MSGLPKSAVLWVDDDPLPLSIVFQELADRGITVVGARSVVEAKRKLGRRAERFDLAIIDFHLGTGRAGDDSEAATAGLALARWIREKHPRVRLLGCSIGTDGAEWFHHYGAGFLHKALVASPGRFADEVERMVRPDGARRRRVFLVHGHDAAAKEAVARVLEKFALEVTILDEQANRGLTTVIEKLGSHADADYAVVLLTGDDWGGLRGCKPEELRPRARQNVVLELGYFAARLGRNRVSVLYEEGVEIPSDTSGVLWIGLDASGGWQLRLARELKAAGLPVEIERLV
jgi:hypothetical protein